MIRTMTALIVLGLVLLSGPGAATRAEAQEWIAGAGFADFNFRRSQDTALLSLEYIHEPFHSASRFEAAWSGAAQVHATGDIFVGIGITATYALGGSWFVQGSVMPGAYVEHLSVNNLGSRFEIRSLLGVGYRLGGRDALSLAVSHLSNASTAQFNPGVNSVLLRYHRRF